MREPSMANVVKSNTAEFHQGRGFHTSSTVNLPIRPRRGNETVPMHVGTSVYTPKIRDGQDFSRPARRSHALRPVGSLHRQSDTSVSKAPTVSLPPPPLR